MADMRGADELMGRNFTLLLRQNCCGEIASFSFLLREEYDAGVRASPQPINRQDIDMEMKKINSGKLRAIGYDARPRLLQVQLDDGSVLQYSGVGEDAWRRLSSSGAAWSFYRDNIEEEFTVKRVSGKSPAATNPLDELFGKP